MRLLKKSLILIAPEVEDQTDLLTQMSAKLLESGSVTPNYLATVLTREKTYPTGLAGEKIGCGIPHGEMAEVLEPAVALAIVPQGVTFHLMADPTQTIDAKIIFFLAINEGQAHLKVLQALMALIQSENRLRTLLKLSDVPSIYEYLSEL